LRTQSLSDSLSLPLALPDPSDAVGELRISSSEGNWKKKLSIKI